MRRFRVDGLTLTALLLMAGACTPEQPGLLLDLERCTIDNTSFDRALHWKPGQIDLHSPRYRRFEQLVAKSAPFGVHYGICNIDSSHGQAMLARLVEASSVQGKERLQIRPALARSSSLEVLEQQFGQPGAVRDGRLYRPVLHTDGSVGQAGEWDSICPGFRVKFTLDDKGLLSSILISPLDEK